MYIYIICKIFSQKAEFDLILSSVLQNNSFTVLTLLVVQKAIIMTVDDVQLVCFYKFNYRSHNMRVLFRKVFI